MPFFSCVSKWPKKLFLKYYLQFWTSFLNFYLLDTVFCEPWLCTLKLRLVSTVVSLGTTKSVLCTRTWSVTKFMTYDSVGFKYWYKKKLLNIFPSKLYILAEQYLYYSLNTKCNWHNLFIATCDHIAMTSCECDVFVCWKKKKNLLKTL